MDSKILLECVRWVMMEMLRIFWNGDREAVAKAIREILDFEVPCIGVHENRPLVQRTDLSVDEEILLLLHFAGDMGYNRTQLGRYCLASSQRVSEAIARLISPGNRLIRILSNNNYVLTGLGHQAIREQLSEKLLAQTSKMETAF